MLMPQPSQHLPSRPTFWRPALDGLQWAIARDDGPSLSLASFRRRASLRRPLGLEIAGAGRVCQQGATRCGVCVRS